LNCVTAAIIKISAAGQVVYTNAAARRLFDTPGRAAVGMAVHEFEQFTIWPDGSPCRYDDYPAVKALLSGDLETVTMGLCIPGQEVLWVKATAVPVLNPSSGLPESVVITVVDSHHPSHVDRSLRESEDRYRRLVEHAPDTIVVHRNGIIQLVNDAGVKLWGARSREDLIGRSIFDFVHPNCLQLARRRVASVMGGQSTPLIEQRHVRFDGRIVHVEVTGTPCTFQGQASVQVILRDVTKSRRVTRLARRQGEMLRKFFNRIPLIVGLFDTRGRVKVANREWKRVFGWKPGQSVEELLEICYPDSARRAEASQHVWKTPSEWRDFQMRLPDGSIREIAWANIQLTSGARITVGQDVTERRKAEEYLRHAKAELEQRVRERTEELSGMNAELQQKQRFMERTLQIQERERQLVAYEMHDTFLQEIIGALMYVDATHHRLSAAGPSDLDHDLESLDEARRLLRQSIGEARRMISGLRPLIIDEQGIVAAIEYLVSEINARGLDIKLTSAMKTRRLAAPLESTIFRIVQEALTNLERHSQSRSGQVELTEVGETIHLVIRDSGVGFDMEQPNQGHFGLEGIT
ncbi:MAG: PAS domain S-box protein, partial [Planctomycetota bacterium]